MAERACHWPQGSQALWRETPATESRNLHRESTAADMSIYRFVPGEGDPALVCGGGGLAGADLAAVAEPGHAAHREAGDAAGELGRGADVGAEVARTDRHGHRGWNQKI